MEFHELECPVCLTLRVFAQPPCVDGHGEQGEDCPEWACVECGHAIMLAVGVLVDTTPPVVVGSRAA